LLPLAAAVLVPAPPLAAVAHGGDAPTRSGGGDRRQGELELRPFVGR
jgi:hypothetical protein